MLLDDTLVKITEGLVFVSEAPISSEEIADTLGIDHLEAEGILESLCQQYEDNKQGFCLRKIAGGYQFFSSTLVSPYLEKLFAPRFKKLSNAAYETLAIISYRQPVTRSDIEAIRGVKSEGPLQQLLNAGLVEEKGRRETPGRPVVFGTTSYFLQSFGLLELENLPNYELGKTIGLIEEDITKEENA